MNKTSRKIYEYLLDLIAKGKISAGDRLPTETELAEQFNTSRASVNPAIKRLESQDLVFRNKRQGTIVKFTPGPDLLRQFKSAHAKIVYAVGSLSRIDNFHWGEFTLRQIEDALMRQGYQVIFKDVPTHAEPEFLQALADELLSNISSSLVILPLWLVSTQIDEFFRMLSGYPGEIFYYNRGDMPIDSCPYHSVCLDPFSEGKILGSFLKSSGHRNFAFCQMDNPTDSYWLHRRRAGLLFEIPDLKVCSYSKENYTRKVCETIRESGNDVTIIAPNDRLAADIFEATSNEGLVVTEDFYLASFDNNPLFRACNLTTVAPPQEKIGIMLAKLILDKNRQLDHHDRIAVILESKLIERSTTINKNRQKK